MANATVVGAGAFGTAMACVLRRSRHEVTLWAREPDVAQSIEAGSGNPRFLAGTALEAGIHASSDLARAAAGADFILMAVPAQHMRGIAGALVPHVRRGLPVVSCAKGVEEGSGALMPEVLAEMLPQAVVSVLSGPSFAREIARDQPCGVVLASAAWADAEEIARRIANPRFCVHVSGDVPGVAIAGAMKNVVSIASGVAHGRGLGENARATIVTLGLLEAARLGQVLGAHADTFLGLAGAGDFMLTAQSLQSRNTALGVAMGEGRTAADVLSGREAVTEGVHSVAAVMALAGRLGIDMPITSALDAVLNRGVPIDEALAALMRHLPPLCRAGGA